MNDQETIKKVTKAIVDHPYITCGVICGLTMLGTYKFIQRAVYTGTLKANKRTVEYISWLNNQIIY